MSRNSSLDTQTGKLFIVIRKNKALDISKIEAYCLTYGNQYAFIEHKGDIKPETGEEEGIHYHIVMKAKDTRARLSTHLNTLCDFFGFDNNHGIQIEKFRTFEGALQYLTHQNFPAKTPHRVSEIVTNIEKGELETYLSADLNTLDFQRVFSTCNASNNILEVIHEIGFTSFHRYRATIWDIWNAVLEKRRIEALKNGGN